MAVIFHLVGLVVGTARVVHDHDEGAVELMADGSIVKLLRGVGLCLAHGLAVLVLEGIAKLLHGLSQGERQHVVNGSEHLCLALLYGSSLLAVGHHLTQLQTKLAEL